jgi:hypothetical protein
MSHHDGDGTGGAPVNRQVSAASTATAALRSSLEDLINESQALRTDVKTAEVQRAREAERRRQENRVMFGLIGILSILMLLMLTVAWQNNQLSADVRASSKQLSDCTTPGGKCYAEGQARTGQAVRRLQLIQLYIVQCSRELPGIEGPEFDRRFEACVERRLATTPPPSPAPTPNPTTSPRPERR